MNECNQTQVGESLEQIARNHSFFEIELLPRQLIVLEKLKCKLRIVSEKHY